MYSYDIILLDSSYNEECFRQKLYRKIKTHFIFDNFFSESRVVYEVM